MGSCSFVVYFCDSNLRYVWTWFVVSISDQQRINHKYGVNNIFITKARDPHDVVWQ